MFRDAEGRIIPNKKYSDSLIEEVCLYYAEHGKTETAKKYPHVNVRTIVERYKPKFETDPRQTRWTSEEIVKLYRLARVMNKDQMAKEMNRPNANTGSIKSFFSKRSPIPATKVAGISYSRLTKQYDICYKNIPTHKIESRNMCYWSDIVIYLKPNVPVELRMALQACAMFEKWLVS